MLQPMSARFYSKTQKLQGKKQQKNQKNHLPNIELQLMQAVSLYVGNQIAMQMTAVWVTCLI